MADNQDTPSDEGSNPISRALYSGASAVNDASSSAGDLLSLIKSWMSNNAASDMGGTGIPPIDMGMAAGNSDIGNSIADNIASAGSPITDSIDSMFAPVQPGLSEAEKQKAFERLKQAASAHMNAAQRLQDLVDKSTPQTESFQAIGPSSGGDNIVHRGDGTDMVQANGNEPKSGNFSRLNAPLFQYPKISSEDTLREMAGSKNANSGAATKGLADILSKKAENTKPISSESIALAPAGSFSPQQVYMAASHETPKGFDPVQYGAQAAVAKGATPADLMSFISREKLMKIFPEFFQKHPEL